MLFILVFFFFFFQHGQNICNKFQIFWTKNSKFIDLVRPQRYCHEKCNILAVNLNEKDISSEAKKSCFWHQLSSLCVNKIIHIFSKNILLFCVEVIFIVASVNLCNLSGRNSLGSAHRMAARKQKVPTSNNESYVRFFLNISENLENRGVGW